MSRGREGALTLGAKADSDLSAQALLGLIRGEGDTVGGLSVP